MADETGGHWVTIDGSHVLIGSGGTITEGPAALKGKKLSDAHDHVAKSHEKSAAKANVNADNARKAGDMQAHAKHLAASDEHLKAAGELRNKADEHRVAEAKPAQSAEASAAHANPPKPFRDAADVLRSSGFDALRTKSFTDPNAPDHALLADKYGLTPVTDEEAAANPNQHYHGGPKGLSELSMDKMRDASGKFGKAIYSGSAKTASHYRQDAGGKEGGQLYRVNADPKNVLDVRNTASPEQLSKINQTLSESGMAPLTSGENVYDQVHQRVEDQKEQDLQRMREELHQNLSGKRPKNATANNPAQPKTALAGKLTPDALMHEFNDLHAKANIQGVRIHELRDRIRQKFGDAAASHENFDPMVKGMRGKQLRLVSGGAYKHIQAGAGGVKHDIFTNKNVEDSIPGANDNSGHVSEVFTHLVPHVSQEEQYRRNRQGLSGEPTWSSDCIILDASTLDPSKEIPGALEGLPTFEEIDSDEIESTKPDGTPVFARKKVPVAYYLKEVARTPGDGKLWTHRGRTLLSGEQYEFPMTREDFDEAASNFKELTAAGIKPFIPDTHLEYRDASANNGEVIGLERKARPDGTQSLIAKIKAVGAKAQEKILKNDVSVFFINGNDKLVVDATGKRYKGRVLHHVALTPNPGLPHLDPFQRIAASADDATTRDVPVYVYGKPQAAPRRRSYTMTPELAQQVRQRLSLSADTVPDDVLDNKTAEQAIALKNSVDTLTVSKGVLETEKTALVTEKTAITKERDDLKAALAEKEKEAIALSADDPGKLTPWNLSAFTMNADTLRENAVKAGRISAADAKSLSSLFRDTKGNPTRLALSASGDNLHPLELNLWRVVGGFAEGIKTGAVPRPGDQPAIPALSGDAIDQKKLAEEVASLRKMTGLVAK